MTTKDMLPFLLSLPHDFVISRRRNGDGKSSVLVFSVHDGEKRSSASVAMSAEEQAQQLCPWAYDAERAFLAMVMATSRTDPIRAAYEKFVRDHGTEAAFTK